MIRLVQRRLIIPRGDTGTFSVPVLSSYNSGDAAVFSIIDPRTHRRVYNQLMYVTDNVLSVKFEYGDTVNLPVGKFLWDIKFYQDPVIEDNQVVSGKEVDSYYAAFTMPECEIRQTGDNMLTADDAPGSTLTPQHINAINAALFALNEAVEKTETNVTHYPTIIDGEWNVWDANLGDYTTTGIEATGNGIASIEKTNTVGLVDTYTVNFTDGTTFLYNITNGDRGIGISSVSKGSTSGLVDTYIIAYTDGTSTSFTVTNGATPNISIGTVQEGPIAAASITGSAANPVLNLTLPNANVPTRVSELENDAGYLTEHQDLSDYVQKTDYATENEPGIIRVSANYGLVNVSKSDIITGESINYTAVMEATATNIKEGTDRYRIISSRRAPNATFYGLAKAAGDSTQSQSSNAVGTYTNEAKAAIQTMLDVPSNADVAAKQDALTFDNAPTANSTNPVTSGGVYSAIANINTMKIHICAQGEYGANGVPTIQNPDTQTFYLVPSGEGNDMFVEWIYANNKWEIFGGARVDLSDYALKSELPTKVSELSNDSGYLTSYTETDPTVPQWAKANTKPSYTAVEVGALPSNTHIPSTTAELTNDAGFITVEEVPEVPVQDVQVNGVSVLQDGVANVPIATGSTIGVVMASDGLQMSSAQNGKIMLAPASSFQIKGGIKVNVTNDISKQHESTFYGLAKAAGADMKDITNTTVGTYPDAQKEAIQSMLGITQMLAPTNPNLVATQAYAIGDVFAANGHLYKATAAIAQDGAIIPDTNCVETTMAESGGKIKDVHVNGTSIVNNGVANIPKAGIGSNGALGVVTGNSSYGTTINSGGAVIIAKATDADMKTGIGQYRPVTPYTQHMSVFYGLSKVAGVDLKDETVTLGTYPETSKAAIRTMIGATSNNVIAVQDTQPTDPDTKIWLPETAGTAVQVPTVAEMNAALAGKISDVQVNGTSVVTNGVANVPIADSTNPGVVKIYPSYGIIIDAGRIAISRAADGEIKGASGQFKPIVPINQYKSVFYGLAQASGDTTQSASSNAVGTYTDNAKASIKSMLGIVDGSTGTVSVSGTTPAITAVENTRYVCGEVSTLSFTPPASGISIVRFTSGTTAAVLTLPSTVKFPEWFDATSLEADTIYEICITDGIYGAVMSWAL